jgi:hypothetical protein
MAGTAATSRPLFGSCPATPAAMVSADRLVSAATSANGLAEADNRLVHNEIAFHSEND